MLFVHSLVRARSFSRQMFITTDEEDEDEDEAVDYKYGLAHNHRLLGAITEVRYNV